MSLRSPIWAKRRVQKTYKKRLSRLFLAIRNLAVSNPSHEHGNDRRLSGMITIGTGVCASIYHVVISYGVRLRVARSTWMGTCQSLELRDEHQVWLSRFFCINQSTAKERVRQQQCRKNGRLI